MQTPAQPIQTLSCLDATTHEMWESQRVNDRAPFAGGDQAYLRDQQYGDSTNLDARTALHQRFSTATDAFPDFAAGLIEWSSSARILECGTGSGRFWDNTLTPRSLDLTLTDLSPGMVSAALTRASEAGFGSVEGRECDVQALPFDNDTFDVVIANHMLYHVPDPDLAIREMARVVAPGGTLLASTNGFGHMDVMKDAIAEAFGSHEEDELYAVFGIDTGERRLRQSFRHITWHAYDNDLLVTDLDAAVAYGLSFPPGDAAGPEEQSQFRAAFERRSINGVLRIRTRTGVFVCRDPRSK